MSAHLHRSSIPTVVYQDDLVTLFHGDCRIPAAAYNAARFAA